jgi:hypothetical protein
MGIVKFKRVLKVLERYWKLNDDEKAEFWRIVNNKGIQKL